MPMCSAPFLRSSVLIPTPQLRCMVESESGGLCLMMLGWLFSDTPLSFWQSSDPHRSAMEVSLPLWEDALTPCVPKQPFSFENIGAQALVCRSEYPGSSVKATKTALHMHLAYQK